MSKLSALKSRANQTSYRNAQQSISETPRQPAVADPCREENVLPTSALFEKLTRIEEKLDALLSEAVPQDHYSVADVARFAGRAEFTVRQWCLQGRIRAEKRACGRGLTREWMISREELQRWRSEGLLPMKPQPLRRA